MTKPGSDSIGKLAADYLQGPFGLSFFMAWIYGVFYSSIVWDGGAAGWTMEYPWIVAMSVSGAVGVCGALALGMRPPQVARDRPWIPVVAALLCATGTLLIGGLGAAAPVPLVVVGALLVAVGFSTLTLVWGARISACDDAMIEFSVPMSFIVARVFFAALVLFDGGMSFVVLALMPLVSVPFLKGRALPKVSTLAKAGDKPLLGVTGVVAVTAVLLVFRIGYGMLRTIAAGTVVRDGWYAFSLVVLPVAVFGVFVVLALTAARSISSSLVSRWVLPVLLLALAVLPLDGEEGYRLARDLSSIASIILQAFFWILLAKAAHRRPGSGAFFFSCYLVGLCLGMVVGVVAGLWTIAMMGAEPWQALPFLAVFLVAAIMALESRAGRFGLEGDVRQEHGGANAEGDLVDAALKEQARRMADEYGLSPREEEIVGYLLAGRNRPYIRDALFISLNTVNTHIKNAFAKLDIHSQQELLDIARAEFPVRHW